MLKRKKSLKKPWSVSEKLEIVQARQQGMLLSDLSSLYGASQSAIIHWTRAYEAGGIAGLEPAPTGGAARRSARVEAAEQALKEVTRADPEADVGKAQGALYRHGFLDLARETVRRLLRGQGHGFGLLGPTWGERGGTARTCAGPRRGCGSEFRRLRGAVRG